MHCDFPLPLILWWRLRCDMFGCAYKQVKFTSKLLILLNMVFKARTFYWQIKFWLTLTNNQPFSECWRLIYFGSHYFNSPDLYIYSLVKKLLYYILNANVILFK